MRSIHHGCHAVARREVENDMKQQNLNVRDTTYIGIDAHPTEHTALAIDRFEDEKGQLRFANTKAGINACLTWIKTITPVPETIIVGIEGGSTARHALVASLLGTYDQVYEVNPLYTKQRRSLGT